MSISCSEFKNFPFLFTFAKNLFSKITKLPGLSYSVMAWEMIQIIQDFGRHLRDGEGKQKSPNMDARTSSGQNCKRWAWECKL